jgi:hypothetical protein
MRYAAPASRSAEKAGCDARSTDAIPTAVATAQTHWALATPAAVETPARRPRSSLLRIVSAVSGPGTTITSTETPRNAPRWAGNRDLWPLTISPGLTAGSVWRTCSFPIAFWATWMDNGVSVAGGRLAGRGVRLFKEGM